MIEISAEEILSELRQRVAAQLAQAAEEIAIQSIAIRKLQERVTELEAAPAEPTREKSA